MRAPSRFVLRDAPSAVDRDGAARTSPSLAAELETDPAARVVRVRGERIEVRRAVGETRLALRPLALGDAEPSTLLYLGRTLLAAPGLPAGTRICARLEDAPADLTDLEDADPAGGGAVAGGAHADSTDAVLTDAFAEAPPAPAAFASLRELSARLSPVELELATTAIAVSNWREAHRFSPRTGARLAAAEAGWLLADPSGAPSFPRTDAAVIGGVLHGEGEDARILLGANVNWRRERYSLLAGFVEPGESFEDALAREVREESGARIANPRYVGSQPWPFPASIMVGFLVDLAPGHDPADLVPEPDEIDDLRWFTRAELLRDARLLPPESSIAGRIIAGWRDGTLA